MKGKLLIILGPTATGKTDLALNLAKKFSGELVSCDSRQVYRGLDIGTGKYPSEKGKVIKGKGWWKIDKIKVWGYDVADPKIQHSVYDYVKNIKKLINDINTTGKLPIIVGGTGLYLKAILEGLPNLAIPIDKKLRGELEKLSLEKLQEKLKLLSLSRWKNLNESDRQNKRRLLRSIELIYMNPYVDKSQISNLKTQNFKILKIGLTAPRGVLYRKIDMRLNLRFQQGLLDEVKSLHNSGLSTKRMKELGLEYGILSDWLEGKISKEVGVKLLKTKIHQYAKRQLTWFKKEKNVIWFDITNKNFLAKVEKRVYDWYNS